MMKPRPTVFSDVTIWSKIGRLAGVVAHLHLVGLAGLGKGGIANRLALVELRLLDPFGLVVGQEVQRLLPHLRRPGQGPERGVDARSEQAPGDNEDGDADKRNDEHALQFAELFAHAVAGRDAEQRRQPAEPQRIEPPGSLVDAGETPLPAENALRLGGGDRVGRAGHARMSWLKCDCDWRRPPMRRSPRGPQVIPRRPRCLRASAGLSGQSAVCRCRRSVCARRR